MKFFFHWEQKDSLSASRINEIKTKTKRRARRHFQGKPIRHRVVEKTPTSITFAFQRRSGGPSVTIRWRMELLPLNGKLRKPKRS